jgi:DNA-binding beta-propeller fold protein YncE
MVRRRATHARAHAVDGAFAEALGPLDPARASAMYVAGEIDAEDDASIYGSDVWLPLIAWAALDLGASPPPRHVPERLDMPERLVALDESIRGQLRWWLRDGGRAQGPMNGAELLERLREPSGAGVMIALVGGDCWFPRAAYDEAYAVAWRAEALSAGALIQCGICLEDVSVDSKACPECGERLAPASSRAPLSSIAESTRPHSIPDDPPGAGWLRMHWRPTITMSAMFGLIAFGIALRHLAPDRYRPPDRPAAAAVTQPACDTACWHGEACQLGKCVWQMPNDLGHVPANPTLAGPFELPSDVVDVLPLDADRYAVSYLRGVQITNSRTGGVLSLVSDAPQTQKLYRVGDSVYATSPKRIYVIDAASTRVLKTIEIGSPVSDLAVGASGRRVVASVPGSRAVALIATDYHAEVARFFFGDDAVRAVAIDDTGERALTINGKVPLRGLRASRESRLYGAMYAFDPSRLPSGQDRVRTGLAGNPVDIIMATDNRTSYALLREKDAIVRLEHLESGAIRQQGRLNTCREPEEMAMIRRGRRAIVRCNTGRAIEVFDLHRNELVRTIPLNARVSDMVVTPDGRQAILALPREGGGAIGLLDLDEYELTLHEVNAEPHRVRLAPDGRTAVVISDRSKVAWVLR